MSIKIGDKIELVRMVGYCGREIGDTSTVTFVGEDGSFLARHNDEPKQFAGNLWFDAPVGDILKPSGFHHEYRKIGL